MYCVKSEEFYPNNIEKLLELLCDEPEYVLEINSFARVNNPLTLSSLETKFKNLNFKKLDSTGYLMKEYSFTCKDEEMITTIKDRRCEVCGSKIIEHDDFEELVMMSDHARKTIKENNEKFLKTIVTKHYSVLKVLKMDFSEIIPFLGAGVSIPAKMPSWKEIIKMMSEDSDRISVIDDNLEQNNYLDCFPIIYASSQVYKDSSEIKKYFSTVFWKKEYSKVNSNHIDFLDLESKMIITTNYDCILDNLGRNKYLSRNFTEITDISILNKNNIIIHLHGSSNPLEMDSMIIDKVDYEGLYHNEHNKRRLQSLLGAKKILFFGYSLDDYYFIEELMKISEANNNYIDYYAIMINQRISELEEKSTLLKKIKYINIDVAIEETFEKEEGYIKKVDRSSEDVNTEIVLKVRYLIWYLKNKIYV